MIGVLLVVALVAGACGDDDDADTTTATEETTATTAEETTTTAEAGPVSGGTLVWGQTEDLEGMDPEATGSNPTTCQVHHQVYEYLTQLSPDGSEVVGALGDYEWSDDLLTLTFSLEEGVKFHDGSDLTAEDVVFSLERAQAGANYGYTLAAISAIDAPDDYTVVLTLSEPNTDLPAFLSYFYVPIYPADFGGMSEEEYFANPIGAGPFKFVSWEPGNQIVLERFDDYYGEPAFLDGVTFQLFSDPNAAVIAYENGEVDALLAPPFDLADRLPGNLVVGEIVSFTYFMVNQNGENLGDVHARRALAYAIDREEVQLGATLGYSASAVGLIGPVSAVPDLLAPADEPYTYDPDQARAELEAAGMPDGYSTAIQIPTGVPQLLTAAEIIKNQTAEVGIDISIEQLESGAFFETLFSGQHDIAFNAVSGVILPNSGEIPSIVWGTEGFFGGYDTTEVGDCVMQIITNADPAARQEGYRCFENWVVDTVSFIPIYHPFALVAVAEGVEGVNFDQKILFDGFDRVQKTG
jgi:peptide/nickel transport system substrate-binding protein